MKILILSSFCYLMIGDNENISTIFISMGLGYRLGATLLLGHLASGFGGLPEKLALLRSYPYLIIWDYIA